MFHFIPVLNSGPDVSISGPDVDANVGYPGAGIQLPSGEASVDINVPQVSLSLQTCYHIVTHRLTDWSYQVRYLSDILILTGVVFSCDLSPNMWDS